LPLSQHLSPPPVILNKSDRSRKAGREGAVKNPEVIPTTIQHQGVSTTMHGQNSLKGYHLLKGLGSFTPRRRKHPNEAEFRRSVQDDRRGEAWF